MFITLRGGLSELTKALVKEIQESGTKLLTGRSVRDIVEVKDPEKGYTLVLDDQEKLPVDQVVLATPAFVTAKLLKDRHPRVSALLEEIPYCSTANHLTGLFS